MTQKKSPKREAMEARIVTALHTLIDERGLDKVGARDVAKKAGISVGAIYTAFADLDHAIFAANADTLMRMRDKLEAVDLDSTDIATGLRALAASYARFAMENPARWKAIFLHRQHPNTQTPQWYLDLHLELISRIFKPLTALRPDLDKDAVAMRARTMFGAVHGVVQLALEKRFVAVTLDNLENEVGALVDAMTRGLS